MKCTLMHRRIVVAEIELDDATGFIQKVEMLVQAHKPVQTMSVEDDVGGRYC